MSSFSQTVHKKIFFYSDSENNFKILFHKGLHYTKTQPRHHQTQFTKLGRHNDLHSLSWPTNIIPLDDI